LQFFSMRCPLWPEDGSVIYLYKCYCALPALSVSVQVSQNLRPYLTASFVTGFLFITYYNFKGRRSGVELNLRPAVSRPVHLGAGPPFGAHDQILNFLYSDIYLFLYVGCPLWRDNGSVPCSAHCWVQVLQNLRPNLTVSFETGFPFCRLLRLVGLQ
jgi:hypothetical protein